MQHYPENFLSLSENSLRTQSNMLVFLNKICALFEEKKKQTMTKKPLPTPSQIFPTNAVRDGSEEREFFLKRMSAKFYMHMNLNMKILLSYNLNNDFKLSITTLAF